MSIDAPQRPRTTDLDDAVPDCPEERESLRMHARAIAATAVVVAIAITLLLAVAVAWLMQPLRWPTTVGTVEQSTWFTGSADEESGASVTYVYDVDGVTYRSNRLSLFRWGGRADAGSGQWPADERALVKQHQPGDSIQVRYDPSEPGRSVVVCHWNMPGLWGAAGVLVMVWIVAAEAIRRSRGPITPRLLAESGWRWGHPD